MLLMTALNYMNSIKKDSYIGGNKNYIIAEIDIGEKDLDKNIRIINSFDEVKRRKNYFPKNAELDKYENEKEIKKN